MRPASSIVDFLRGVALFADLDPGLLGEVARQCQEQSLQAGAWLFRQGDPGDTLFVVRSGRLEVVAEHPSPQRVLAVLGPGSVLGELALLTHGHRSASVRAVRDTELVTVAQDRFRQLLADGGRFAVALTEALARQLSGGVTPPAAPVRRAVIALLPLTDDLPVGEVHRHVAAELGRTGSVAAMTPPAGQWTQAEQCHLLDRHEATEDHILLVGAAPPAGAVDWNAFCVRQADRVVLLITPHHGPAAATTQVQGCDVAVVSSRRPRAAELAPWLDAGVRASHWLPTGAALADATGRLARRLTGRAVGVVLSGGGARGLAHVGVVEALLDAGVKIDRFGGTSIGACVSALMASDRPTAAVVEALTAELVEGQRVTDWTVPRFALIRGRRAAAARLRLFGDTHAEELSRSWFAVSADLLTADVVVHRRGPIRDAVAASMALPGLLPPEARDGRLLVDGGVVNNLPVDVMAADDEGPVIAVDAMSRWGRRWRERHEPERWRRSVWARMGWPDPLPTIGETLARSIAIGSLRHVQAVRDRAVLTITPELTDVELLDWQRLPQIVRQGRQAAAAALATAPATVTAQIGVTPAGR